MLRNIVAETNWSDGVMGNYNIGNLFRLCRLVISLATMLVFFLSSVSPAWSDRRSHGRSQTEEKRMERQFEKWKSLPREEQETLRKRMEQFKELPPKERQLYQHRFQQWQELSPKERDRIRKDLENWNTLSPEEQQKIRRKFRSD
jgi:hypothetical protein